MKFGLMLPLEATGLAGSLGDATEQVAEHLAELQGAQGQLLDFGLGSDADTNTVTVELTVTAEGVEDALQVGLSWLRSGTQAAGASTPGWENVAYEFSDEEGVIIRPLERVAV